MDWEPDTGTRTRSGRLTVRLAFVASALLALPPLASPLFEDDVFHRAMLLDRVAGQHWGALELYEFVGGPAHPARELRERGFVPWFTADDLKLRFFRPLSSATLALDARLFGSRPWAARLQSLGWFLGVLCLVTAVYRRFLSPSVAGLATLIYSLSVAHTLPVSWIAARHALVSSALALLSFYLYLRSRDDGWRAGGWLAPLAFAASLFAGEMALGGLALIAAFELVGQSDAIGRRMVALAPFALIALLYLGLYVSLDYGARGSGGYIGLDGGLSGALMVVQHFWVLLGEMVAGTPSDAVAVGTVRAQTIAAFWGAVSALIAWATFRVSRSYVSGRNRHGLGWMVAASATAALPGTFGLLGGRVLTLALVPASGFMAVLLVAGAAAARDRSQRRLVRAAVAIAVISFALTHLVVAPLLRVALGVRLAQIARAQQEEALQVPACPGVMVIVAADDPTIAMYVPATLVLQDRAPERVRLLSMAADDHRIENVTPTGFDLVTSGRVRGRTVWERLYRSTPLPAGTRVTLPSFDATVVEDRAGAPARTRFDFREPLDSPHLCFVQWRDGRLVRLTPPKPGETVDLPHYPGLMSQ
jgi:hypothetical protein